MGEFKVIKRELELLVVKVDHMRNVTEYVRTLEGWTISLNLHGFLVFSKDKGIIFLLEGDKGRIGQFLINWKTVNIDVDSRGRPCKERMMQLVFRNKVEEELLPKVSP